MGWHNSLLYSSIFILGKVLNVSAFSSPAPVESLRFLSSEEVVDIKEKFGSPVYVYDKETLVKSARDVLNFPNAFGVTPRFAMKACPNAAILKLFSDLGIWIDASSGYEVERAMRAGVPANHISLSTQELPTNFADYRQKGVDINCCSLSQLERYGRAMPGTEIGIRFNPGLGSGGTGKTNVGGPSSSFGIWYQWAGQVQSIAAKHDLTVTRVHTHIGSGSDPAVWQRVAGMSLNLVRQFPTVKTLNLGGGYKVGRMSYEKCTDLDVVGAPVREAFVNFAKEDGRELHLEIEPGTYLVANSCSLVCTAQDIVSTVGPETSTETGTDTDTEAGAQGHHFIKLDSGMTEVLRPSLYGAQHPLVAVPSESEEDANLPAYGGLGPQGGKYVVVGHCCESGDLLTPAADDPEAITERDLGANVKEGDAVVVEGSGAYCSSMSSKNYNSYPEAPEVLRASKGAYHLIRKRQTLDQMLENEIPLQE